MAEIKEQLEELGLHESDLSYEEEEEEDVVINPKDIPDWIKTQQYLPQNIDNRVLQSLIDWPSPSPTEFITNFFRLRQIRLKLFRGRQPGCELHTRYSAVVVAPFNDLPYSPCSLIGTWLSDADPNKFSIYHLFKLIFTELDLRLQEGSLSGKKMYIVMDMELYTAEHMASITRYAAHVISEVLIQALPVHIQAVLVVNPCEDVATFTARFPALDFRILPGIDYLPGFVPLDMLPSDMAGSQSSPTRDQLAAKFRTRLWDHAGWLASDEKLRDEELAAYSTELPVPEPAKAKKPKGKKPK